mmetsp:Transcript_49810/g.131654  ORF Transcript_49810/g.131654 Transcript_49810/m.131654 type:complete len:361 (+) Transcript_49810:304-1386(+)
MSLCHAPRSYIPGPLPASLRRLGVRLRCGGGRHGFVGACGSGVAAGGERGGLDAGLVAGACGCGGIGPGRVGPGRLGLGRVQRRLALLGPHHGRRVGLLGGGGGLLGRACGCGRCCRRARLLRRPLRGPLRGPLRRPLRWSLRRPLCPRLLRRAVLLRAVGAVLRAVGRGRGRWRGAAVAFRASKLTLELLDGVFVPPQIFLAPPEVITHLRQVLGLPLHSIEVLPDLVLLPPQGVLVALRCLHVHVALALGAVRPTDVAVGLYLEPLPLLVQPVGTLLLVRGLQLGSLVLRLELRDLELELVVGQLQGARLALGVVRGLLLGVALLEELDDALLRLELRLIVLRLHLGDLTLEGFPLSV